MRVPRVFIDTGAWAAVQITDDEHHDRAVRALRALLARPAVLVTTNHVVGETYTLLRVTRGYGAASRFLDSLEATARLESPGERLDPPHSGTGSTSRPSSSSRG